MQQDDWVAFSGPQVSKGTPKLNETQAALLSVAVASGTATAAGVAVPGAATLSSVAAGAGVAVSIPVAGWIIGGSALLGLGIMAIVRAARNGGRAAAKEEARKLGIGGDTFVNTYAKLSSKPLKAVRRKLNKWAPKLKAAHDRGKLRKEARLVDKVNAAQMVLFNATQQPRQPQIRGERATIPEVADESIDWDAVFPWAIGSFFVAGTAIVVKKRQRRRT